MAGVEGALAGVVRRCGNVDDGNTVTDRDALAAATVTAKVLGEDRGEKLDIFKYKNKTGYRRRMGHRQKYTKIKVTTIDSGAKAKPATKKKASSSKSTKDAPKADSGEKKASKAKSEPKPKASKAKAEEE